MQTKQRESEEEKPLSAEELKETIVDLSAEESDAEFAKTHNIKLRRPPQTSTEALKTLKEVDARYEVGAKFLSGTPFSNIKKPLTDAEIK